jgi:hypothetical protein
VLGGLLYLERPMGKNKYFCKEKFPIITKGEEIWYKAKTFIYRGEFQLINEETQRKE